MLRQAGIACLLALMLPARYSHAQASAQTTAATEDVLHAMVRLAGVVFTGQVVEVRRHDGDNGATGTMEIEFAVEDALRGVSGGTYTLREWAGLWSAADQPFRPGQSYLMLLHAPGAAGLSSPVGGMDGAIPICGIGAALSAQSGPATDSRLIDLRWIQTRVIRPISYRVTEHQTALPVSAHPEAIAPVRPAPDATASALGSDAQVRAAAVVSPPQEAYATMLTLLRNWVKEEDAAR